MPRSCFLPDVECSAEEKAEAERLCLAEGVDPRGRVTWTWTYPDGGRSAPSSARSGSSAYLDAARALMRTRWPRGELTA